MVVLDNGLHVILVHDPSAAMSAVCVGIRYGGAYAEGDPLLGDRNVALAHLVEHNVLRGTANRSAVDTWKSLRRFTNIDCAETDREKTVYYFETDRAHLSRNMAILADTIKNAEITQASVRDEKRAVVMEKLERDEVAPIKAFDIAYDLIVEGREGQHAVIGDREKIESTDWEKISQAYKNYYTPDNAVVAICGSLSLNDALKIVKKHFGDWKGKAKELHVHPQPRLEIGGREKVYVNNGSTTVSLTYAFDTMPINVMRKPDREREHMALELISMELSDRLEHELRLTNGTGHIYHPDVTYDYGKYHSLFTVTIRADPVGDNVEKAKQLLYDELKKTFTGGVTKRDIIDHRDSVGAIRIKYNTAYEPLDQAVGCISYYLRTGSPNYMENHIKGLKKISPDYIRSVAAKYLDPDKALKVTMVPTGYVASEPGAIESSVVADDARIYKNAAR